MPVALALGSAFAGLSRVTQQSSGGCCLGTTWPVYITGALLSSFCLGLPSKAKLPVREQRAQGMY